MSVSSNNKTLRERLKIVEYEMDICTCYFYSTENSPKQLENSRIINSITKIKNNEKICHLT